MKPIDTHTEHTAAPATTPRRSSRPRLRQAGGATRTELITEAIVANYVLAISTRGAH